MAESTAVSTAYASVDAYIAAHSELARARLREMRAAVREAVPEAAEGISYGMPTYRLGRKTVHFGAAKRHCALYGAGMQQFEDELRPYQTARGTVRFPLDQPIPAELVRKIVVAKLLGS